MSQLDRSKAMSEARKAFESHVNQYDTFGDEWQDKGVDEHFIAGYEAGKAARAGQESEPFAFCFTDVNGKPSEFCDHPKHAAEGDTRIRTPLYTHTASRQAASMPEANKAWASSDPSWLLAHFKEETLFDAESIGEMLASAKAAATSIPAKAASVPKQWVDLMRELVKDLISEIKTKQKLKPDERVAEDLGAVREAIAMIAEQEQDHE
jgi:hypothetical protein